MADSISNNPEVSPVIERQLKAIENDNEIKATEKEAIIKARIGQGVFRQRLMDKYNSKCIITGIDETNLLVVSHNYVKT